MATAIRLLSRDLIIPESTGPSLSVEEALQKVKANPYYIFL